jgi:uroporphyrinogen-III synthase
MSIYLLSPIAQIGTIHLPMIKFKVLDVILDFEAIDILMFTSKQAVKSAETLNPKWKDLPCLAIGKATATMIKSLGGTVIYQPKDFYAQNLAKDIIKKFKDKNILYLRPKSVSFDSKGFLEDAGITLKEKIIYETSCIAYEQSQKPKKDAIIIFTSPSTIKCFLKNFTWESSYHAIVIGKATQKHLPESAKYSVADVARIEACVEMAFTLR